VRIPVTLSKLGVRHRRQQREQRHQRVNNRHLNFKKEMGWETKWEKEAEIILSIADKPVFQKIKSTPVSLLILRQQLNSTKSN
jgi:hypothetical protein